MEIAARYHSKEARGLWVERMSGAISSGNVAVKAHIENASHCHGWTLIEMRSLRVKQWCFRPSKTTVSRGTLGSFETKQNTNAQKQNTFSYVCNVEILSESKQLKCLASL